MGVNMRMRVCGFRQHRVAVSTGVLASSETVVGLTGTPVGLLKNLIRILPWSRLWLVRSVSRLPLWIRLISRLNIFLVLVRGRTPTFRAWWKLRNLLHSCLGPSCLVMSTIRVKRTSV